MKKRHLFWEDPVDLLNFIEKNKRLLKPPVCNSIFFNGALLKIMLIGGPNERDDYHLQSGEELFLQIRGNMDLNIMDSDIQKQLSIPEDHMMLLPSLIPHSPQRYLDTIGMVFERSHFENEMEDSLIWYQPDEGGAILYKESFFCHNLGTQLKPIIERFHQSNEYQHYYKSNRLVPKVDEISSKNNEKSFKPYDMNTSISEIKEYPNIIVEKLVDSDFQVFKLTGCGCCSLQSLLGDLASTSAPGDWFLWQRSGESRLTAAAADPLCLRPNHVTFLPHFDNPLAGPVAIELLAEQSSIVVITHRVLEASWSSFPISAATAQP